MSDDVTGDSAPTDGSAAPSSPSKKSTTKAAGASTDTTTDAAIEAAPVEALAPEPVFPAHEELPAIGGSFTRQPDGSLTPQDQEA